MNTPLRIAYVSPAQVAVGKKLGLELEGKSVRVADAIIKEYLLVNFWGMPAPGKPTDQQCAFAMEFGFDIQSLSFTVGSAVVRDIIDHLNKEAIEQHHLEPGTIVRFRRHPEKNEFVISSISPDGTVYFKGGKRQKAWARSLERVTK